MAGDISPMSPVSPTPLVREKRHYPNEEKEKNQQQDELSDDDEQLKKEADDDIQQKDMNVDKKNVKVGHIDEYV